MNTYNPHSQQRKSIRLKGYDYSQAGLYFITICCKDRMHLFGEIKNNIPTVGAENFLPKMPKMPKMPTTRLKQIQPIHLMPIMVLNDAGQVAKDCWLQIPDHFPNVVLHEFIIMPNHVHGIIELETTEGFENNMGINATENDMGINRAENDMGINRAENDMGINRAENFLPLQTKRSIGSIVKGFKIGVTKWMRQNINIHDVWQRNYYEHIIRNKQAYTTISDYIINNPLQWNEDKFYTK